MKVRALISIALVLFLVACKETQVLYSDLSEREANEILALLYSAGLPGEKSLVEQKGGNQVAYAVQTDASSFPQAMMLLQANDLPQERFVSMGDVFEKSGMVSSSFEESARLNYALSMELSDTLSSIDGVRVARVHLAMPKKASLTGGVQSASAAVFIKHSDNVNLEKDLTKIKTLVVDSIENLSYEDVTVVFFPQKDLVFPVKTPTLNTVNASIGMGSWLLGILGIAVILIVFKSFISPKKKRSDSLSETTLD